MRSRARRGESSGSGRVHDRTAVPPDAVFTVRTYTATRPTPRLRVTAPFHSPQPTTPLDRSPATTWLPTLRGKQHYLLSSGSLHPASEACQDRLRGQAASS